MTHDETSTMRDLSAFKAYDIRGIVGESIDNELAWRVGRAAAEICSDDATAWVVAHDMRPSSPDLARAFAAGVTSTGRSVVDIGLASTDMMYFASGHLGLPGAMFTASHNPAQYNGIKLARAGAAPISADTGLNAIRDAVANDNTPITDTADVVTKDLLGEFAEHVLGFIDPTNLTEMEIAIDAGNGMGGHVVPAVFESLPITVDAMYFDLDGTFPNHPADPLDAANLVDLAERVTSRGLPMGLAFDGDADRVFAVDEQGTPVPSSLIGAVVADRMLARSSGATVLHNLICSRAVAETIEAAGGTAVRTRVGHSFIKQRMAETGAIFACEHSGHYYFADNWRADSGLIAAVVLLEAVCLENKPLSEVLAPYNRYVSSGEINFTVADQAAAMDAVEAAAAAEFDVAGTDRMDGLTVDLGEMGWFNLRPSNTEPLLRLNAEGRDDSAMTSIRDFVAATVDGLSA